MNVAQLKCLSVFAIFAIVGFGPISPGCLIGLYIVWMRPEWFLRLVNRIYTHPHTHHFITSKQTTMARIKSFLSLLILLIIDILPVPVTPMIAFVIIFTRPQWFYRVVTTIYGERA